MKSRMLAFCLTVAAVFGSVSFAQECTTCTAAAPCNSCATCCSKPCDLFGGLKNLMACRPCAANACEPAPACDPVVAAPVAPACAPVAAAPACEPCKKPCKPLLRDLFACKPCCKPCCKPACDPAPACAPVAAAPACEPCKKTCKKPCCKPCKPVCKPVCKPCKPACEPVCKPCKPVCKPACDPACEAAFNAPLFPCLKPAVCRAIHCPLTGMKRAVNGMFVCLADATTPKCGCGLASCTTCADEVATPCGPAIGCDAAPLPASPEPVKTK